MEAAARALRPFVDAADELVKSAVQVTAQMRNDDPANTIPAARLAVARLRGQAQELLARLDDTDTRLSVPEEAAPTPRSHDPALRPERRAATTARTAPDPLDSARACLAGRPPSV